MNRGKRSWGATPWITDLCGTPHHTVTAGLSPHTSLDSHLRFLQGQRKQWILGLGKPMNQEQCFLGSLPCERGPREFTQPALRGHCIPSGYSLFRLCPSTAAQNNTGDTRMPLSHTLEGQKAEWEKPCLLSPPGARQNLSSGVKATQLGLSGLAIP